MFAYLYLLSLLKTLMSILLGRNQNLVAAAWTGVTAQLLSGDSPLHSLFKLPIPILDTSNVTFHQAVILQLCSEICISLSWIKPAQFQFMPYMPLIYFCLVVYCCYIVLLLYALEFVCMHIGTVPDIYCGRLCSIVAVYMYMYIEY